MQALTHHLAGPLEDWSTKWWSRWQRRSTLEQCLSGTVCKVKSQINIKLKKQPSSSWTAKALRVCGWYSYFTTSLTSCTWRMQLFPCRLLLSSTLLSSRWCYCIVVLSCYYWDTVHNSGCLQTANLRCQNAELNIDQIFWVVLGHLETLMEKICSPCAWYSSSGYSGILIQSKNFGF